MIRSLLKKLGFREQQRPKVVKQPAIDRSELLPIVNTGLTADATSALEKVEALRERLLNDQTPLEWDRPWLAHSKELRDRLGIGSSDPNYPITITTAKAAKASRKADDCRVLMSIVLGAKPKRAIEMGTNVGISGATIGSAMQLHRGQKFITLEGSKSKGQLAAANLAELGLTHTEVVIGDFADTLDSSLERLGALRPGVHRRIP